MQPGYIINQRYKILSSLGEGGMANVYLAHDLILDRDVSVKLLRLDLRDDEHTKRRFQREAMAATQLDDPHIVGVYDVGEDEDNGMQYLVMEYVAGTDLKQYINKHFPIPFQQVIDIMEQILSAVQKAHEKGIIHRDLKPQNILIDDQGNIKITDFGIAVAVSQNSLTQTNTVMGSVHYLSPEQARGSVTTKQSDIYSLGIILYELLTGKVPFEGETAVSIALKHFRNEMPSVREFDPRIPQALENIVLKATAKSPSERYQSASEMGKDLSTALSAKRAKEAKFIAHQNDNDETKVIGADAVQQEIKQQKTDSKDKQAKKTKKRRRWPWILLLLLMIIGGISAYLAMPRRVVVPDLNGLTTQSAKTKLKDRDLEVGTIRKKSSETIKAGHIISIKPKSQRKVAAKSKVNLVVSTGHERIKLSNYVGNSYSSVAAKLRLKGIKVYRTNASSEDVKSGAIMSQSVSAGKKVKTHGTSITFKVSTGAKKITVPDFTGKTEDDVQNYANTNGLKVSVTEQDSNSVTEGNVISQSPTSGTQMKAGDTISITVAKASQTQTSVSIKIPFDSSNNQTENRIQVYIQDASHNISDQFQDLTISQDTTISVPFTLKSGSKGAYKVTRNGTTIMSADNIGG